MTNNKPIRQLFPLGKMVATPGAVELLERININPVDLLRRHVSGDWGDLDADDKKENDFSVSRELRILSAYKFGREKVWIITEADRSVTTVLLPEEY